MNDEILTQDDSDLIAEFDETPIESDVENEFGNTLDEKKEYPVYVRSDSAAIDQHIYSQVDNGSYGYN